MDDTEAECAWPVAGIDGHDERLVRGMLALIPSQARRPTTIREIVPESNHQCRPRVMDSRLRRRFAAVNQRFDEYRRSYGLRYADRRRPNNFFRFSKAAVAVTGSVLKGVHETAASGHEVGAASDRWLAPNRCRGGLPSPTG